MIQMFLQRKALYNLLQINLPRIESGELKVGDLQPWQIEDYRSHSTDILFERLLSLGISFNNGDFSTFANRFDEPEELLDALTKEWEPLDQDRVFLLIFELWRRYFPEKRSLSVFCDELDYQMTQYDLGHENEIADELEYLLQILEENVDKGLDPIEVLNTIQTYCANEIESFVFDYILTQIEEKDYTYASELLERFTPFVKSSVWFDYLKCRIACNEDPEQGYALFDQIIREVNEESNIELVEEMLYFLADTGNHTQFYALAKKMFKLMQVEEDFREFLEICYLHYDHLAIAESASILSEIFHRRKKIASDTPLNARDHDLATLRGVLDQKLHL